MNNDIKIQNTQDGVEIKISGDVKYSDIQTLTESCSDGKCECSEDMLENISEIQTKGKDGNVTISLKGEQLNADEVASCMNGCDCGF